MQDRTKDKCNNSSLWTWFNRVYSNKSNNCRWKQKRTQWNGAESS